MSGGVDSAINTTADLAMNKSEDSAMNMAADSDSAMKTTADLVKNTAEESANSVVESDIHHSKVNTSCSSQSDSGQHPLFTYLSSSKSESESEVDQVVEDFLNSTDLPEPCCHEINKCSTVLGASSLPTSEAEFSDCDDTEYMMSSDYAYSPKPYLDGTYDDYPLTPSDCGSEPEQSCYFLRSVAQDPEMEKKQECKENMDECSVEFEADDEKENEDESEDQQKNEDDCDDQKEHEDKKEKVKKQKTSFGPNDEFDVIPCPTFTPDWHPPGVTTSMKPVSNPILLNFLSTIKMPLKADKIRFKNIPEFSSDISMIGRVRFLIAKKEKKDDNGVFRPVFWVIPNVLLSEHKHFYFYAPNKKWFYLCPGKGEKRRFDYHIPAPFSNRQNINTACKLNFA